MWQWFSVSANSREAACVTHFLYLYDFSSCQPSAFFVLLQIFFFPPQSRNFCVVPWTGNVLMSLKVATSYFHEGLLMSVLHKTAAFPVPAKFRDQKYQSLFRHRMRDSFCPQMFAARITTTNMRRAVLASSDRSCHLSSAVWCRLQLHSSRLKWVG